MLLICVSYLYNKDINVCVVGIFSSAFFLLILFNFTFDVMKFFIFRLLDIAIFYLLMISTVFVAVNFLCLFIF